MDIDASCEEVFDVIHDYGIRLQWDTFLSKACILDGPSAEVAVGVRTLCVGRSTVARSGMETVCISFDRPRVAAVRMTRGPWIIADFAASIRHTPIQTLAAGIGSRVVYKYRITARPKWLRIILDPLLRLLFQRETRKRLASLNYYIETRRCTDRAIVLFDGVCNLCNASVQFIIARDPCGHFRCAALGSEAARRVLDEWRVSGSLPDSVALLQCGRLYTRSTAVLLIARRLTFPWPLIWALIVVPSPLRDMVYHLIARR